MNRSGHKWAEEEIAYLRKIAPGRSRREIYELLCKRYGEICTMTGMVGTMHRYGIRTGRDGRFKKGCASWNKGKKWSEFMSEEGMVNSRKTQYKKGNIPHTTIQGVGQERVTRDGYIQVHVSEGLQSKPNENWEFKHRLIWEQAHGRKVPDGHVVIFADRNKRNFGIDNLVLVHRGVLAIINQMGMTYYDRDSLEVCITRAKLHSAKRRKLKEAKHDG